MTSSSSPLPVEELPNFLNITETGDAEQVLLQLADLYGGDKNIALMRLMGFSHDEIDEAFDEVTF